MKHFVRSILGHFRLQRLPRRLTQDRAARLAMLLFALVATFGRPTQVSSGECACVSCRQHAGANWFCAPQPTTASLEVTEWGVRSDFICPMHSGLFGSACRCRSDDGANGYCDVDGACDAHGVAGCDACGLDGLAGVDPGAALPCNCASGHGCFLGICRHGHFRLPGIGPRLRQRLMRKTLVYPTQIQEFVAIPCGPDPHMVVTPTAVELESAREVPGEALPLEVPPVSAQSLIGRPPAPVTVLLSEIVNTPAPVVTAASFGAPSGATNVAWIGGEVEGAERGSTMESASDFQPPAPILPARRAPSNVIWPEPSPSHLPNSR